MKNRSKYTFSVVLMLLPIVLNVITLFFLPDKIPLHYNVNYIVDRRGSKFEILLFAGFVAVFGLVMFAIAKYLARKENSGKNNEGVVLVINIMCLIMYNVLNIYILYLVVNAVENLNDAPLDPYKISCSLMGLLFVVTGNVMPKARLNSIVGLRTSWSMKNEQVWKKCQRFSGIFFMVIGLLVIIGSLFIFNGAAVLIWTFSLIMLGCMAGTVYSYIASKIY